MDPSGVTATPLIQVTVSFASRFRTLMETVSTSERSSALCR